MYESTQQFLKAMDSKDLHYDYDGTDEHGDDVVVTGFSGNYISPRIIFFFYEDNENLTIRTDDLVKFPEDKLNDMLAAVNEQNVRYRFVKFVVDMRDNTIHAEMDAIFHGGDIGLTCLECFFRTCTICDEAYSAFMKKLWGSTEDTED